MSFLHTFDQLLSETGRSWPRWSRSFRTMAMIWIIFYALTFALDLGGRMIDRQTVEVEAGETLVVETWPHGSLELARTAEWSEDGVWVDRTPEWCHLPEMLPRCRFSPTLTAEFEYDLMKKTQTAIITITGFHNQRFQTIATPGFSEVGMFIVTPTMLLMLSIEVLVGRRLE